MVADKLQSSARVLSDATLNWVLSWLSRLITANFMHAGFLHLSLNLYALYSIAPEAEAVLGYWPFAAIYLGSGLAGSILCFLLTNSVTVGASGALFGLIGESRSIWRARTQLCDVRTF